MDFSEVQLDQARNLLQSIEGAEFVFSQEHSYCWLVAYPKGRGWPVGVANGRDPKEAAQRLIERLNERKNDAK